MHRIFLFVPALCLTASLCACQAAQKTEQPFTELKAETTSQSIPAITAAPTVEPATEPSVNLTVDQTAEPTAKPAVEHVNPYAWLGYDALPVCTYFDAISNQVFYREYDAYALGYVSHSVEASDGVNVYSLDGLSGTLTLILDGKAYSFNTNSKIYMCRDMTDTYQTTLEQRAQRMEQGLDTTGKAYKGTGSEPIPLYCDKGDAESYTYYEFFTDGQYPMTERIYYKDGDVFAIYNSIATGADEQTEITQVITAHSASPDPALFALPNDFDEYTLYE